jgi:kynureninase
VIRVAPVPMYNNFEDVYDFTARLRLAIDANE